MAERAGELGAGYAHGIKRQSLCIELLGDEAQLGVLAHVVVAAEVGVGRDGERLAGGEELPAGGAAVGLLLLLLLLAVALLFFVELCLLEEALLLRLVKGERLFEIAESEGVVAQTAEGRERVFGLLVDILREGE